MTREQALNLAASLTYVGRADESQEIINKVVISASAAGDIKAQARAQIDSLMHLGVAGAERLESSQFRSAIESLRGLVEAASDPLVSNLFSTLSSEAHWQAGDLDRAIQDTDQAIAHAAEAGSRRAAEEAIGDRLLEAAAGQQPFPTLLVELEAEAAAPHSKALLATVLFTRAATRGMLDDVAGARSDVLRARDLGTDLGVGYIVAESYRVESKIEQILEDVHAEEDRLSMAVASFAAAGIAARSVSAKAELAVALAKLGRTDEAEVALAGSSADLSDGTEISRLIARAFLALAADRPADALAHALRADELSAKTGKWINRRTWLLIEAARVGLLAGDHLIAAQRATLASSLAASKGNAAYQRLATAIVSEAKHRS